MLSETAVRRVRTSIVRASRSEPGSVRATLPFDPTDADDIDNWMKFTAAKSQNENRYKGADSWVVHSLVWDAKAAFRKARRKHPRDSAGKLMSLANLEEVLWHPDKSIDDQALKEAAESLAAAAAIAALSMEHGEAHLRERSARSALTCLGRVFAGFWNAEGEEAARHFLDTLILEPGFRRLQVGDQHRQKVLDSLGKFTGSDNSRNDLQAVDLPWPGSDQWKLFRAMFGQAWVRQNGGSWSIGGTVKHKERVA